MARYIMANTVITKSMTASGDIGATYDTVLKKLTSLMMIVDAISL